MTDIELEAIREADAMVAAGRFAKIAMDHPPTEYQKELAYRLVVRLQGREWRADGDDIVVSPE
jgi:hypothetical protein